MVRQSEYSASSITVSWYLSATAYGTIGSSIPQKQPSRFHHSFAQTAFVKAPVRPSHHCQVVDRLVYAFSAAEAWLAANRSLASPGLPFCGNFVSTSSLATPLILGIAHLPLDETDLGLATALSDDALVLLQAAADGAGRDAQVAVVAVRTQC